MHSANHPLRFAFVSTMRGVPWGGSEELWSAAALRLHEAGHHVEVSVLRWPERPSTISRLIDRGLAVTFRARRASLPRRVLHKLTRRFSAGLIDPLHRGWLAQTRANLVVISQGGPWDGVDWMLACRQLGLPYCCVVQANSELWWPQDERLPAIRSALTDARGVHFVSRANQQLMRHQTGLALPHSAVVANPTKIDRAHAEPVPWPAGHGPARLACVGRLTPSAKGQDLLLQVLARPAWRQRPLRLSFFGAGDGQASLQALAAYLGLAHVEFRGHVADLRSIWADHHLLVLPSRFEGLPIAIVEAMLCGRPVVATDVAGSTEFIRDGHDGFVVPAPTVALLDETLERAWSMRERWAEMGTNAFRTASEVVPLDPIGEYCSRLLSLATSPATTEGRARPHRAPLGDHRPAEAASVSLSGIEPRAPRPGIASS